MPLFARSLEREGNDGARTFASEILAALLWTLIALTAIAEIAMPALVYLLAPGFYGNTDKFELTVLLSRIAFPYLLCMSLIAFIGGILNTFGKFAVAALAPVLLNVVMISALTLIGIFGFGPEPISGVVLATGVAIAGFVQLAALIWALRYEGFRIPFRRPRITGNVRRLVALGIPGIIAGGITQINIMIGTIIASAQDSAVSYLYIADRVYQLPLGVVGIAIGVILLPELSRKLNAGERQAALDTQNRSLEFSMALTVPAAIALVLIANEIVHVLFERGAFTAADRMATADALAAFAIGLPAFVLIKVFSPAFFAREDTRTPMWFAGVSMVVNVAGSLALFPYYAHVGIAIATSVAGWVNAALLFATLVRRDEFHSDPLLLKRLGLLCLASMVMGACVYAGARFGEAWLFHQVLIVRVVALGCLVGAGAIMFFAICQATGVLDLRTLLRRARGRKAGTTDPDTQS